MKSNRLKTKQSKAKAPQRKKSSSRGMAPGLNNSLLHIAILLTVCGVLFFSFISSRSLFETDEARYAELAREMYESGDLITPRLNYVKYFEKPPLTYWLTTLSFVVFGVNEAGARMVPAVFGTLTVLLIFLLGRSMWGDREGLFAGLVLAASAMFFGLSRIVMVDMVLCFGVVLALYGAWQVHQERSWGLYPFWVGLSVGFLSKGLLGPGLPVMALVFYAGLAGHWRFLTGLMRWQGPVLFTILCAPWVIWVSLANPEFFGFFFIDEHFGRLLTKRHQRFEPYYYYLGLLPAGFFPWIALAPWAWARSWPGRAWRDPDNRPWLFCMVWLVSFFLFFTASSSKMMHYILPLMPALALLFGRPLASLTMAGWKGVSPRGVQISLVALALLTMAAGLAVVALPALNPDISFQQAGLVLLFGPALAAALGLAIFFIRQRIWAAVASPLAVFMVMVLCAGAAIPHLEDYRSMKPLVEAAEKEMKPSDLLVSYGDYFQGVPFYTERRAAVVQNWGELDFGRRQAPQDKKWFIPTDDDFLNLLLKPNRRILAFAKTHDYLNFKKWAKGTPGLLLFEWVRIGERSLFSNRPKD